MSSRFGITFLGGLGEIGRNCAVLESGDELLLLDCGLMFPDLDMLGIDLVLPDFAYLREHASRIVGCVATHGHEDHVGGLSYLLRDMSFPVFGSPLTLGLARSRIDEAGLLGRTELVPVGDGERRRIGRFDVEFVPVSHSVPHGFATVFRTEHGVLVHSGDWKLDLTPIDGRRTDLGRIGAIADSEGIRVLLSDSTNAEEPGHAPSERAVGGVLQSLFREEDGRRVVIACFASHVHRVQQIADAADATGRKVALLGRSMLKNVDLARSVGILRIPEDTLVDIGEIDRFPPGQVCIVSTGSQGEPMSALALMSRGGSRFFEVGPDDTVILSSHPIPGNEMNVSRVIDGLVRRGVRVVHSGIRDVHATGHAQAEELKTLLAIAQPEWFVPVHGEYRHLAAHAQLARDMGVPTDRVLICEDGDRVSLGADGLRRRKSVPAGYLYVDGIVGDISHGVLRDRRHLADEGVLVAVVTIDIAEREIITGPDLISRGWIEQPSDELVNGCAEAVRTALVETLAKQKSPDIDALHQTIRSAAGRYVKNHTKRRPMILPLVVEA